MKYLSIIAFILVFAAEFLLFDRMTSLYHAKVYPRWNSQIQPLVESYTGYEYRQAHGFWPGLGHNLTRSAAQGTLHSFWALLSFEAAGRPSRSAALAINMVAFLVWQAVLAFAVVRGSGSRSLAWLAVGLTLALAGPWSGLQGSATDFRPDQVTLCMMGISLAAALLSDGFRSARWSGVFGVAVALTLLTHFVTGAYFLLIFGACLVWTLVSRERSLRTSNLRLAAVIAAVLATPCFWFNRRAIYQHYWVHPLHPDGTPGSSHLSFGRAFLQFWEHLCSTQLGVVFWLVAGFAILVMAGAALFTWRRPRTTVTTSTGHWIGNAAWLGAIFLLAPVIVLALQNNVHPGPALGAAVPGAVVLVLALCARLRARTNDRVPLLASGRLPATVAAIVLAVAGIYFVVRQVMPPYDEAFASDVRQVQNIADRVLTAARKGRVAQPRIVVDQVTDFLDGTVLSVIGYERHQTWTPFIMDLPAGTSAVPEPVLLEHLANSDFVFATEDGPVGEWPYDQQMFRLRPKILAWCEARLQLVERFTILGHRIALYQRPEIGAAPIFLSARRLLASTQGDYFHVLKVARGPARYQATGLPPGLELDADRGWIRGRPTQQGTFTARITASNQVASTTGNFTFLVEDTSFQALVNAPVTCTAGRPVELTFEAFDTDGRMNFIEVTDLTAKKTLGRLDAGFGEQRRRWQGSYVTTFSADGTHSMLLRFVRFEPGEVPKYTFVERFFEISVVPATPIAK